MSYVKLFLSEYEQIVTKQSILRKEQKSISAANQTLLNELKLICLVFINKKIIHNCLFFINTRM